MNTLTSKSASPYSDKEPLEHTTVTSRRPHAAGTRLKLANGESLEVERYTPISKNDSVAYGAESVYVYLANEEDWLRVSPAWSYSTTCTLGDSSVKIQFKEPENQDELENYTSLSSFHYRGAGGAGRVVPIIGVSDQADMPPVIGFVELSSSMIANSARRRAFDAPFHDAKVIWRRWDRASSAKYSSVICRISRFVIHPEVRSLGLAHEFINAAVRYASERWHFGGYRPRFLEITADMLRFYNFLKGSKFVFLGETEGNSHRLTQDLRYLVRKALTEEGARGMPQGGGGILTLQRGYATRVLQYMSERNKSLQEIIESLQVAPGKLDQDMWESLHRVLRRPKPTYAIGLSDGAQRYLATRGLRVNGHHKDETGASAHPLNQVTIDNLNICARIDIAQTNQARVIQDAFGFVGREVRQEIATCDRLCLRPGDVTLVYGASGSGKSLFLESIASLIQGRGSTVVGLEVDGSSSRTGTVHTPPQLDPECTPLDYMVTQPFDDAFSVCAQCGLAEPQLFVRPIRTLSSGQRYRLKVALTFMDATDVVMFDNFCEPLDRFTTVAICRGIRKLAKRRGVAVVVSSAAYDRIPEQTCFDQQVMLRRGYSARLSLGGQSER